MRPCIPPSPATSAKPLSARTQTFCWTGPARSLLCRRPAACAPASPARQGPPACPQDKVCHPVSSVSGRPILESLPHSAEKVDNGTPNRGGHWKAAGQLSWAVEEMFATIRATVVLRQELWSYEFSEMNKEQPPVVFGEVITWPAHKRANAALCATAARVLQFAAGPCADGPLLPHPLASGSGSLRGTWHRARSATIWTRIPTVQIALLSCARRLYPTRNLLHTHLATGTVRRL